MDNLPRINHQRAREVKSNVERTNRDFREFLRDEMYKFLDRERNGGGKGRSERNIFEIVDEEDFDTYTRRKALFRSPLSNRRFEMVCDSRTCREITTASQPNAFSVPRLSLTRFPPGTLFPFSLACLTQQRARVRACTRKRIRSSREFYSALRSQRVRGSREDEKRRSFN